MAGPVAAAAFRNSRRLGWEDMRCPGLKID
jgi:hypothetical protein